MRQFYTFIICILLIVSAYAVGGCSREEIGGVTSDSKPAELTLAVYAPDAPKSRSTYIDCDGITSPDNDRDKLIDGWVFDCLTLFFVNKSTIPAQVEVYRNEEYTAPVTAETFNFNEDSGDAGDIVKLSSGTPYDLYVIANYKEDTELKGKIEAVLTTLQTGGTGGVPAPLSASSAEWNDFVALLVSTGASNLCKAATMPLSFKKEGITFTQEVNNLPVHLLRTRSRIRVKVRNESQEHLLRIASFGFNTNFTKTSVSLFPGVSLEEADAKPAAGSTDAIFPFKATDGTTDNPDIPVNEIKTIFDGYILESRMPSDGYKFELQVSAMTGEPRTITVYEEGTAQSSITANDGKIYLIKIKGSVPEQYLMVANKDAADVSKGDKPNLKDEDAVSKYLWKYDGGVYSEYAKKYIQQATSGNIGLGATTAQLTCNGSNIYYNTGFFFWQTYYYIDKNLQWKNNGNSVPATEIFEFIPVTTRTEDVEGVSHTKTILFEKLVNNKSYKVKEIRRNDFFHVLFNVRYNNRTGKFEFAVAEWTDVGGDISFN